ncbi:unnamed protein product [Allacma fusca]|uniref:Uncharacterized protein n=1 Tax=Allacma fusca TaxID=39272 RepID=A0A8J2L777_9HEXA|nr:unnamed protein product [Allacma fusca]
MCSIVSTSAKSLTRSSFEEGKKPVVDVCMALERKMRVI